MFFSDPATTCMYTGEDTLSLHDALPICPDPILQPEVLQIDTIDEFFAMTDTLQNDSIRMNDSIMRQQNYFSLRDSLYKTLYVEDQIDSVRSKIEDYTLGRIALSNFFDALNKRDTLDRPVRIAFLGDSFIEGDILVGDFRQILQQEFGGRVVGFVPVNSVAAQFRPTVQQKAKGWKTRSMLTDKCAEYTLSGLIFEAEGDKSVLSIKAGTRYDNLQPVSSLKFFYESESEIEMILTCNDGKDTIQSPLKPSDSLDVFEYNGEIRTADFALTNTVGLKALGIAMEDDRGVIVDNFSLRGNSGLILDRLNPESCRDFNRLRQYDLIILQYGLNILDDSVTQYGWYAKRMTSNIEHIKACFPQADILLLGVSDRSRQRDGQFETMPAVSALLSAQRQIAQKSGVA